MKDELRKYINQIFDTLKITSSYKVYSTSDQSMPDYVKTSLVEAEYVVCCEDCAHKDKLQSFIGKAIFQNEGHMYWFEGELVSDVSENKVDSGTILKNQNLIEILKGKTRLPIWLDNLIFEELNAIYEPDYKRFLTNLNQTQNDVKQYLGTYFPRSYAEYFCIFSDLFQIKHVRETVNEQKKISVLSIGAGTGGDILGFLMAIEKYCHHKQTIEVLAVDGNRKALETLGMLLSRFKRRTVKSLEYKLICRKVTSIKDMETQLGKFHLYDFILSSKFVGELINTGAGLLDNSYYEFASLFLPLLSEKGVCLLLDVTTRADHTTFNPILMNRQINNYLHENKEFKTISPQSCFNYEQKCEVDCFCKKTFCVTHSRHQTDISKVSYRLIGRTDYVNAIIKALSCNRLLIHNDIPCPYSENFDTSIDAYLLNSKGVFTSNKVVTESVEKKRCMPLPEECNYSDIEHVPEEIAIDDSIEEEGDEYFEGCVVIDTNVFVECPDILSKIGEEYYIVLSAKVIEELDRLKIKKNLPATKRKKVIRALKNINDSYDGSEERIVLENSDWHLLPHDFDRNSADNLILSVALKHIDEKTILLTSDNCLQTKAKSLGLQTLSLKNYLTTLNI